MIEYYNNKLRKYKNNFDFLEFMKIKKSDIDALDKNLEYQKEKEDVLKILEKQTRITKDNDSVSIENNIKVFNNISSSLYEHKNIRFEGNIELENKYKQRYLKRKKINDLIEIFKHVYSTANSLMEKKLTKITIKDLGSILDRLSKENENLNVIIS
jgi:hypothetical protein